MLRVVEVVQTYFTLSAIVIAPAEGARTLWILCTTFRVDEQEGEHFFAYTGGL